MAVKYTEEQLNTVDKSFLIHLLLQQQEQLEALTKELHASNEKMQLLMEQVILGKQNRFGRSSEKMDDAIRSVFAKWMEVSYFLTKPKRYVILVYQSRKIWNSNFQSSQNAKERKKLIFPDFRSSGSTTICPRAN